MSIVLSYLRTGKVDPKDKGLIESEISIYFDNHLNEKPKEEVIEKAIHIIQMQYTKLQNKKVTDKLKTSKYEEFVTPKIMNDILSFLRDKNVNHTDEKLVETSISNYFTINQKKSPNEEVIKEAIKAIAEKFIELEKRNIKQNRKRRSLKGLIKPNVKRSKHSTSSAESSTNKLSLEPSTSSAKSPTNKHSSEASSSSDESSTIKRRKKRSSSEASSRSDESSKSKRRKKRSSSEASSRSDESSTIKRRKKRSSSKASSRSDESSKNKGIIRM